MALFINNHFKKYCFLIFIILIGCNLQEPSQNHGVLFLDNRVDKLTVSTSNMNDAINVLGEPHNKSVNDDKELAICSISRSAVNYRHISQRLKNDKEIVKLATDKSATIYKDLPIKYRDDSKIALEAIRRDPGNLKHTSPRLKDNKDFEAEGHTSHHPRGSFALKIRKEAVITTLLDVEWQVGKSGVVSPVAILSPCIIGDAIVSRATLHNQAYIEMLELEIGCDVEVIRSGEIIPRIVRKV